MMLLVLLVAWEVETCASFCSLVSTLLQLHQAIAKTVEMIDNVRDLKVVDTVGDMFHGCLKIARNHVINVQLLPNKQPPDQL